MILIRYEDCLEIPEVTIKFILAGRVEGEREREGLPACDTVTDKAGKFVLSVQGYIVPPLSFLGLFE